MFGFGNVVKFDSIIMSTGKMYAMGGYGNPASASSVVQSYNLASGAVATGTAMSRAEWTGAGFSNQIIGMQCGGYSGSAPLSSALYMRFADDTANSWTWTSTTMPGTQRNNRGTSSPNKGFSWAGYRDGTGDLTVNWQFVYATSVWNTGTALPLAATVAGGYPFIHSTAIQALWVGGSNDSGSSRPKQQMIYTFANDSTNYTQTGGPLYAGFGAACGDSTNMIMISAYQGTASFPANPVTTINKLTVSSGALSAATTVPTAFRLNDAAGSAFVGICAGCAQGDAPTPAQTEGAYNYSADTYTLLTAYLGGSNIYSVKRENVACFSSAQTD